MTTAKTLLRLATAIGLLALIPMPSQARPQVEGSYQRAEKERQQKYEDKLARVTAALSIDRSYKRIPLNTGADQSWFNDLAFSLWDGKISREEFITKGVARFPNHRPSFESLADRLTQP